MPGEPILRVSGGIGLDKICAPVSVNPIVSIIGSENRSSIEERFSLPIIETMGLTETGAQILSNPMPPETRKIGSPGIEYGNEIIIGDENQNSVATNEEGEILVRGRELKFPLLR